MYVIYLKDSTRKIFYQLKLVFVISGPECGKVYMQRKTLKHHIRVKHKIPLPSRSRSPRSRSPEQPQNSKVEKRSPVKNASSASGSKDDHEPFLDTVASLEKYKNRQYDFMRSHGEPADVGEIIGILDAESTMSDLVELKCTDSKSVWTHRERLLTSNLLVSSSGDSGEILVRKRELVLKCN